MKEILLAVIAFIIFLVGTEVYNVAQELRISNDLKAQAMNIDITPIREKYPAFGLEDKSE